MLCKHQVGLIHLCCIISLEEWLAVHGEAAAKNSLRTTLKVAYIMLGTRYVWIRDSIDKH